MRKSPISFCALPGTLAMLIGSVVFMSVNASSAIAAEASAVEQGKKIAFDRKKGNCLACHEIAGGTFPGDIGPALNNIKSRYPDKDVLRTQIWDATKMNPNTIMPPFGKHKILTEQELDLVVEYIYTL